MVGRFSGLAGVAFAVLLVSGAVQGIVEVASFGALIHTAFGRAVLIKVVVFGILVGIGWVNRSRLLPPCARPATALAAPASCSGARCGWSWRWAPACLR